MKDTTRSSYKEDEALYFDYNNNNDYNLNRSEKFMTEE
jgi:hypothetical protein